jgi:hypothetical protein
MMTRLLSIAACLLLLVALEVQGQSAGAATGHGGNTAANVLETKIRKAWQDYKNGDKKAFAAIFADGFAEVTNDAEGPLGKDAELAEMDHFHLAGFELKDFKYTPIGTGGALMTYTAEYSGSYDNAPLNMRAMYGEVWVKRGGEWKVLWVQETKLKQQ